MSDEPLSTDQPAGGETNSPGEWSMPEPVFRSSKGHTPKGALGEPDDDQDMVDTDPNMDSGIEPEEDISDKPTIEITGDATKIKESATAKPKRGCLSKFLYLILAIALIAAIGIFAVLYFFYHAFRSVDGLN